MITQENPASKQANYAGLNTSRGVINALIISIPIWLTLGNLFFVL